MSTLIESRNRGLMKIGAISALCWVALQIVGNGLHPRLPSDYAVAMEHIAMSEVWFLAHVILISDYFLLIPMIVGFAATFPKQPPGVRLAIPIMVVAVTVGIVQVALHPTTLAMLGMEYAMAAEEGTKEVVLMLYEGFWRYNIVLEVGHLLLIHLVVLLIGISMLKNSYYPRWIAILGVVGGIVAAVSLVIGEVFLESSVLGDTLTFGIGLLPSAVWLVSVGVHILRNLPDRSDRLQEGGAGS